MRVLKQVALLAAVMQAVLAPVAALADISTDTVRQRAQQACYDDANRLCPNTIPDEDKTTACMKAHRRELTPRCKDIFDTYVK